jgi:hypothetical protein
MEAGSWSSPWSKLVNFEMFSYVFSSYFSCTRVLTYMTNMLNSPLLSSLSKPFSQVIARMDASPFVPRTDIWICPHGLDQHMIGAKYSIARMDNTTLQNMSLILALTIRHVYCCLSIIRHMHCRQLVLSHNVHMYIPLLRMVHHEEDGLHDWMAICYA